MTAVFYCRSDVEFSPEVFEFLIRELPENLRPDIKRFKKWEDRQRALFAKLLLARGLKDLGLESYGLHQIKYTRYDRPYFNGNIDFNISHSGSYVVCAISIEHKVGIDVEEIRKIPLQDFDREFSRNEMKAIYSAINPMREFYRLWTQKEAFLKAIGTGLNVPLNLVSVVDGLIFWEKKKWFLAEIGLPDKTEYVSHVCVDLRESEIVVRRLFF